MAIFTNAIYENTTSYVNDNIEPTMEGSAQIMYEFASDMYKLISATYISDIMIESAITEGATDVQPLMEKTVKEFAKNAKEKFIELKNKIVAWFKNVIDKIKVFFMNSSKFIVKYEKAINDNIENIGSFEYTGYKYSTSKANSPCDIGEAKIAELKGVVEKIGKTVTKDEGDTKYKIDETIAKTVGDAGVSGMKDDLIEKMRGGRTSKDIIKVAKNDVSSMIDAVKNSKQVIENIEKLRKKTNEALDGIIKEFDTAENRNINANAVTTMAEYYNKGITAIQAVNTVAVNEENTRCRQFTAVLKKLATAKKKTTESFGDDDFVSGSSIFESALNMLA